MTDWVSIHGIGELPLRHQHIRADFSEEPVTLPADLQAIRKVVEEEAVFVIKTEGDWSIEVTSN